MAKIPKNEDGLDKLEIYNDVDAQGERPLSGTTWPGYIRNWIYSRKLRPTVLTGCLTNSQTFEENWLSGLVDFFNSAASYGWNAIMLALQTFLTKTNSVDADVIVTDTQVAVASAAASVLTVPAGHAYKVTFATIRNNNRVPITEFSYTPNGGTAQIFSHAGGSVQAQDNPVIGGNAQGAGIGGYGTMINHLWMQVGDTLEISDGAFVAADVMRHCFIFEDYTL